ncbi:hypothetical protein SBA5_400063 [Candidatus Sulfotelmatomonas gaucii]|uniref:Uncharacterized protein n=1 Tax=Candidatus Sulfuritelmatomonas gaucii TaxID=2043161 RepID=A0A2N9LK83_9BACT|nr:hypothetical protein SBA5_400063 [Candidatus Sulfotelmatomonas gaucii]
MEKHLLIPISPRDAIRRPLKAR